MLPNLIVIGAGRCGTTSLHRYLSLHPEIEMAPAKEIRFFNDWNWHRGLAWYESQFPKTARVVGESSPSYTGYPVLANVPGRTASVLPGARLVYLVRDPIERILVLEQRALAEDRAGTLRRVFRFLGVDETFRAPEFERTYNRTEGPRASPTGRRAIRLLDAALGPRLSVQVRTRAPAFLVRPFERRPQVPPAALSPELRERLVELFRPDADRLREYTGEAFAHWSV